MHIDNIWDVENYNRQRDREKAREEGAKAERERIRAAVASMRHWLNEHSGDVYVRRIDIWRILDAKEAE